MAGAGPTPAGGGGGAGGSSAAACSRGHVLWIHMYAPAPAVGPRAVKRGSPDICDCNRRRARTETKPTPGIDGVHVWTYASRCSLGSNPLGWRASEREDALQRRARRHAGTCVRVCVCACVCVCVCAPACCEHVFRERIGCSRYSGAPAYVATCCTYIHTYIIHTSHLPCAPQPCGCVSDTAPRSGVASTGHRPPAIARRHLRV